MELMLDKCTNKKNMFNHIVTGKFRGGGGLSNEKKKRSPCPLLLPDIHCLVGNKAKKTSCQEEKSVKLVYHR